VGFLQVVITDDAQELRDQGLAGNVATTQKALISGANSRVRLSMMSWGMTLFLSAGNML